jgi:hypothetical protein
LGLAKVRAVEGRGFWRAPAQAFAKQTKKIDGPGLGGGQMKLLARWPKILFAFWAVIVMLETVITAFWAKHVSFKPPRGLAVIAFLALLALKI